MVVWGTARAETLEAELQPRLPAAIKQLESQLLQTLEASKAAEIRLPRQYPAAVRHLRFPDGMRFADVPSSKDKLAEIESKIKEVAPQTYGNMVAASEQKVKKLTSAQQLPPCLSSDEESINFDAPIEGADELLLGDLLFLGTEPPLDYETRYGEAVTVHALNRDNTEIFRGFAEAIKITCLPTRIRMTGRGLFRYEGGAALRRFSDNEMSTPLKKTGGS